MQRLFLLVLLSMSSLVYARDYKLGLIDIPENIPLYEDRTKALESWDWRNVNGVNWLTPVRDQGNCGSCVAFAAVAALEAQYKIASGQSWLDPQFSPQQLFNCGGGACEIGWQLSPAMKMLKNKGVVDAACSPYESGATGQNVQCLKNFCERQAERTFKIVDYTSPSSWGGSAAKLKSAIKKGPVVTGMTVYEDFMTYTKGIYKSNSNRRMGGHAVTIVGFNDVERYWIIKNSWGEEWGEKGFGRISYDDKSGVGESTYSLLLKAEPEYISITSPENRSYMSGEKNVVVEHTQSSPGELVVRGEGELTKMNSCDETGSKICQVSFDTTRMRDGRYEVYAQANGFISMTKEFFVVNKAPSTKVEFRGSTGVDLSKPQKGRIEFDLDVLSSSVMPKDMQMILRNEKGENVLVRDIPEVFPKMRLGLRTNHFANGTYKLFFISRTPLGATSHSSQSNTENLIIQN